MAKKKTGGPPTKADAVRETIREGIDKPAEAVAYIKEKFGLDITPQQVSTYRSIEKKRAGGGNSSGGRTAAPERLPRRVPAPAASAGNPADLARQIKALVETFGAGPVKSMVEVFE
jgi:hypothetical protein